MEVWDIYQNFHNCPLNFPSADLCLDPLNPLLWDNTMAVSTESLLINQPFNSYPDVLGKEAQWTHQFLVDENQYEEPGKADKQEGETEGIIVHSPTVAHSVGSNQSGIEEQHSEILCAEEVQQSDVSEDSGSKKSSEDEILDSKSRKRKKSMEKGPKYAFKTRSDTDVLEDGFKWRKYGRKFVKSNPHPRSYYRCSDNNCGVKKRVERDPTDPGMLITTYEGKHNHESPSVIYYIGKPIILQQPGSKPAIVLVNAGLCS